MRRLFVQVFSFDVVSKVIIGVLGMVFIRYMPRKEYAEYTFYLSIVAFATQSMSATFNRVYVLSGAKRASSGSDWTVLAVQLSMVLVLLVIGFPMGINIGWAYLVVALAAIASCLSDFSKTFYQCRLNFFKYSLIELSRSSLFFISALFVILFFKNLVLASVMLGMQAVTLAFTSIYALKGELRQWRQVTWADMREFFLSIVVGEYAKLFIYFFIVGLFSQIDIFMLRFIGNEQMIATYGSAFRYYAILLLALNAVHAVMLPMVNNFNKKKDFEILFEKQKKVVMLFAVCIFFAASMSGFVIPLIDMGKYPLAVPVFRILCLSVVVSFAFSPYVNVVMKFKRFNFLLWLVCLALATSVMMNFMLIPLIGAVGVAVATMVSTAVLNVGTYFEFRRIMSAPDLV